MTKSFVDVIPYEAVALYFSETRTVCMRFLTNPDHHPRPELELLICCARTHTDEKTVDRSRSLLAGHIDWDYLIQSAFQHGLIPLLYWNLKAIDPNAVPENVLDQLEQSYRRNAAYNLFLTSELLKLQALFEAHDIPVFTFKGPVLASSFYGDPALRQFVDLDVLVRKQDVSKASRLLVSQGLRCQYPLTDEQMTIPREYSCERGFVCDDRALMIDLHWAMVPLHYSFATDPESLWARLDSVNLNGRNVLTIGPDDLFLFLCIHGARPSHCWQKLSWICDLAEIIRVHRNINWRHMIDQAGKTGSRRMLFLGMFLASDLLEADLPDEIVREVRADPTVERLAGQVYRWLVSEVTDEPSPSKMRLFHLSTMMFFRDRSRFVLELLRPTPLEWQLLSLPRSLHGLYYVLRPLRLAGKFGREFLMRISPGRGSVGQ